MPSAHSPAAQFRLRSVCQLAAFGVQDATSPGAQHTSTHRTSGSSSEEQLHQSGPPWRDSSSRPSTSDPPGSPVDDPMHRWAKLRAAFRLDAQEQLCYLADSAASGYHRSAS